MDLNIPGEILNIYGSDPLVLTARVSFAGVIRDIKLARTPHAQVGDYVLVQSGFSVGIIDDEEATRLLLSPEEVDELEKLEDGNPIPRR